MALKTKDKVYLVLLALAAIGCLVVYILWQAEVRTLQGKWESDSQFQKAQCEQQLEKRTESGFSSLVTALGYAAGALQAPAQVDQLHQMLDQLVRAPEIELLVVADEQGSVTASTDRNLIGRPFQAAMGTPLPTAKDPAITKTDTGWRALIPLGPKDAPTGAVGANFSAGSAEAQ